MVKTIEALQYFEKLNKYSFSEVSIGSYRNTSVAWQQLGVR